MTPAILLSIIHFSFLAFDSAAQPLLHIYIYECGAIRASVFACTGTRLPKKTKCNRKIQKNKNFDSIMTPRHSILVLQAVSVSALFRLNFFSRWRWWKIECPNVNRPHRKPFQAQEFADTYCITAWVTGCVGLARAWPRARGGTKWTVELNYTRDAIIISVSLRTAANDLRRMQCANFCMPTYFNLTLKCLKYTKTVAHTHFNLDFHQPRRSTTNVYFCHVTEIVDSPENWNSLRNWKQKNKLI